MKIITPGNPNYTKWWIGLVLTCGACGQTIQLEKRDELHPYWMHWPERGTVQTFCTCCASTITGHRPETTPQSPPPSSTPSPASTPPPTQSQE